jgi:hypothetical protein
MAGDSRWRGDTAMRRWLLAVLVAVLVIAACTPAPTAASTASKPTAAIAAVEPPDPGEVAYFAEVAAEATAEALTMTSRDYMDEYYKALDAEFSAAAAQACTWFPSNDCPAPGSHSPDYPCFPGQIKANLNSRIYHMPGQRYYALTGSGRTSNVWCVDPANEWEVQSWGFRRSLV